MQRGYEQLKWESLKKRRKISRLIMLYKDLKGAAIKKRRKNRRLIMLFKDLKGAASIPINDLVALNRRNKNHHSLAFQTH